MRDDPERARGSFARRLVWLLLCLAVGALVGVVGQNITGNSAWLLAIPAMLAIGWLFHADPTQCEPRSRPGGKHDMDAP